MTHGDMCLAQVDARASDRVDQAGSEWTIGASG